MTEQTKTELAALVVETLTRADDIREIVASTTADRISALTDKQVAALLHVGIASVRRNEELMGLSRYIDGVGRRWAAEDIHAFIKRHPQGARGRRRTTPVTVEEVA